MTLWFCNEATLIYKATLTYLITLIHLKYSTVVFIKKKGYFLRTFFLLFAKNCARWQIFKTEFRLEILSSSIRCILGPNSSWRRQ